MATKTNGVKAASNSKKKVSTSTKATGSKPEKIKQTASSGKVAKPTMAKKNEAVPAAIKKGIATHKAAAKKH